MYKEYVLSQYANSPRIVALLRSFEESLTTENDVNNFYQKIFNIKTAVGYGLDFWGKILNISRTLTYNGQTFVLNDELYRFLLMIRATANITNCTVPNLTSILSELFKDRGNVYVFDTDVMQMKFVFTFYLTDEEKAILSIPGIPPLPTGVGLTLEEIPVQNIFGFQGTELQPFNQAPFRGVNQ